MSVLGATGDRRLLPRWRDSASAVLADELSPARAASLSGVLDIERGRRAFADLLADFRDTPSLVLASEIVATAFSLGDTASAKDAALFVLAHGDSHDRIVGNIARAVLEGAEQPVQWMKIDLDRSPIDVGHSGSAQESIGRRIAETKHRLAVDPRNALAWIDLARLYATAGHRHKADRAVTAALSLQPSQRFIVRSAARYFVHSQEPDRADYHLRRSRLLQSDPWVLATEIAVSTVLGKTSRHVRMAERALSDRSFAPRHLSELAGALASVEALNGKRKAAERLFRQGLVDPTENLLAQAEHAVRVWHLSNLDFDQTGHQEAHEAHAWVSLGRADYGASFGSAVAWMREEPYSSRAAVLGTAVGAVAGQPIERVRAMAELGLLAHRGAPILLNNLAFAQADAGLLLEAAATRGMLAHDATLEPTERVAWQATGGIIEYRSGRLEAGSRLYSEALGLAVKQPDQSLQCKVLAFWAAEAVRARSPEAEVLLTRLSAADVQAVAKTDPFLRLSIQRVQRIREATGLTPTAQ